MVTERKQGGSRSSTAAIQKLESLERAGVKQLPKPGRRKTAQASSSSERLPITASEIAPSVADLLPIAGDSLEVIRQEVAACRACHELATTRTQTVFGVGNPQARVCFLGEAPGADEDQQGEPFVGRAGQLLTKIIEACT